MLLPDMPEAVARIYRGLLTGEKMAVYGDFDVDGITATALLVKGISALGGQIEPYIPHRLQEGHGLNSYALNELKEKGVSLIITADCGVTGVEQVAKIARSRVDVIISDHHLPGDELPAATAVVNPHRSDSRYPFTELAGVGVAYKLLSALYRSMGREAEVEQCLYLVALGTVADMVPLLSENRFLVVQGLAGLRTCRQPGVTELALQAGVNLEKINSDNISWALAPRLNAAGRLEDMRLGIECLLAPDLETALPLAQRLHEINQSRKDIESDMKEQALTLLEEVDCTGKHGLAIHHPEWHAGVIGILASRLKEKYHRPVIAFAPGGNGELKGSGRSIPALHLRDALDWIDRQHPGLILKFGGHAMAAGLTIREEGFAEFQQAFEALAQAWLTPADLDEVIETDGKLAPGELDFDVVKTLENAVWGQGFPAPLFQGEFAVLNQRVVGEKHLKLDVSVQDARYEAMAFFHNEPLPDRFVGVYAPMLNEFNGRLSIQLKLQYWESLQ